MSFEDWRDYVVNFSPVNPPKCDELESREFWQDWWDNNRTVVPAVIGELAPPPDEDPEEWEILVWPDGAYTDRQGHVLEPDSCGRLEWSGEKRSLQGVHIRKLPLIWYAQHDGGGAVRWPVMISPVESRVIYYRYTSGGGSLQDNKDIIPEPPKIQI